MKKILLGLASCLTSSVALANICGTDYQSFNPTTNGLDFVTVQSSETLKPCIINMGWFVNYAANSLTYSKTINPSYQSGQRRNDRILGMDLSAGIGLTDRWDFGINVPMLLAQEVEDDAYVSTLSKKGITEVKANTKYRLVGDENGGLAAVLSMNKNLIEDNPFAGRNPGLTWNYELVADTVIAKKWAAAVNFGYRDRHPGATIPNLPYVPMEDQWIYSIAGSYLIASLDTKIITELYGSRAAKSVDAGTGRALNSLEALVGLKHDYSQNLAMHVGGTHRIDYGLGGAEWRIYAGLNWAIGPVCKTKVIENSAAPVGDSSTDQPTEVYKLDVELLFPFGSDKLQSENVSSLDETLKPVFEKGFKNLIVEGHTDSVGSDEFNLNLSERRAETIKNLLIERYKLDPRKVKSFGKGESEPIADNANYQGRRKNRRVELKIWRKPVPVSKS